MYFSMSGGGTHQPVREGRYLRYIRSLATKAVPTGSIAPELLRARPKSSPCFYMLRSLNTLDITRLPRGMACRLIDVYRLCIVLQHSKTIGTTFVDTLRWCFEACWQSHPFPLIVINTSGNLSPPAKWGSLDFLASSRSQWAPPDLNWQLLIAVGITGPQLPVGHSQTSTALIAVGTAGHQLPVHELSWHCRTSTASSRSQWALPCLNHQKKCQNIYQIDK